MSTLTSFARDLRSAVRQLRHAPLVSGVALLSLALGIGANVAIFSLVNALLLKALPVHQPDRLVEIYLQASADAANTTSFTNPQWEYLRDHQDFFVGASALGQAQFNLNTGGEMRRVAGMFVDGRFFDTLGVTPFRGRLFTAEDDRRGGGPAGAVAVISHGFWQRQFGGDPSVVGRSLMVEGHPITIVGITPPEFFGFTVGRAFDVALPLGNEPIIRGPDSTLDRRSTWWLSLFARLAPGQTAEQATAQLRALQPQLREASMPLDWRREDQDRYITDPFTVRPAGSGISTLRTRYSQPLYVLLGIVGLVLAIACANMANLLLAQSLVRRRELAVRLSLGAGRWQLIRQLLAESVLLSLLGAGAGLLVASWGSRALVAMISTRNVPVTLDLAMDWRVFAFTAAIGLITGLLFGVAPALRGTSVTPADALRDHARGVVTGGGRLNLGHALVAVQVALSFVLVFGSILFVRTLVSLTTQNMGFDSSRVLLAMVDLRRTGADASQFASYYLRVRDAVAAVPGVEAAAASFVTPVSGSSWNLRILVPGFSGSDRDRSSLFNGVTQDYFRALSTPVLVGREIASSDLPGRPNVAVVNEAFAKKYFAAQNPVGKTFTLEHFSDVRKNKPVEIVGMVTDAKYRTIRDTAPPTIYASFAQYDQIGSTTRLAIKTTGAPMAARAAVLAAIASVNKEIAVDLRTLDEDLGAATLQERLVATLSAFFGGLALLLAALGLYGVMSYSVTRRTNEIGVRVALGAEPGRVIRLVLGNVAMITAVGLLLGAVASIGSGRFINSLLYNLAASDAMMIAVTMVTLGFAAAVAGYLPARRAARIDPMRALREN